MTNLQQLKMESNQFIQEVENLELNNAAAIKSKETLENTINQLIKNNEANKEALDIATHAIEILKAVSDEAVSNAYKVLQESLNSALARIFINTTRQIEIKESLRGNQYPQLELILHIGNGKTRSIKSDSGHGIAQIISLLSILNLIVLTGSRRILVMDEILSGLSVRSREIITDILWTFTEIGFQFIICEHGYIPKGSHVYHLEMVGNVSTVKEHYIEKKGIYLQGTKPQNNDEEDEYVEENIEESISISESNGVISI